MFRDPKLRVMFIILGVGYAVLVGVFLLSSEQKEQSRKSSADVSGNRSSKTDMAVRMKPVKDVTAFDEEKKANESRDSSLIKSKKVFYKDGTLSAEWIPLAGKPGNGTFKAYYSNGTRWLEASFVAGRLQGPVRTAYPDGALWTLASYENGIETGDLQFFYPSSKPWIELRIEDGASKGLPVLYSESGESRKVPAVSDREGNKYFKVFDARGDVVTQWAQAGGAEESAISTFYDTGEKSSQWNVLNSQLNGSGRIYYPGETVWREYEFVQGKISGVVKSYYSDGSIWTETRLLGEGGRSTVRAYYPGGIVWFVVDPSAAAPEQPVSFFSESYAGGKGGGGVSPRLK